MKPRVIRVTDNNPTPGFKNRQGFHFSYSLLPETIPKVKLFQNLTACTVKDLSEK